MEEMVNVFDKVVSEMVTLQDWQFMSIMCSLFDEYHANHPDCNSVEMAKTCADMVEKVNSELGVHEYNA